MRIPIEKHVFELLKYNDCVIITGFGGFILHHRNAYLNKITQTIHPPSKRIGFNKNLCNNDGLLARYLSKTENITYDEACLEILKFSRKANLKLKNNKAIFFDNIGEISNNKEGEIAFKVNTAFNFNSDSYGLREFHMSPKSSSKTKTNQKIMPISAAVILLIFISIFSVSKSDFQDLLAFNLSPLSTDNYSPRNLALQNDSLGKETPGIYNVQVSKVDPDLYKINGTNYHITTKRCFKEGFGRDVQIKIWIDEKDRTQRQVCFLNAAQTEYNDCFKIVNVYNELSSNSNKIIVLMKNGKMKEALLVLEESYIDPYVIANTIPEEEEAASDSLMAKDIPSRFINAIQTIASPEKKETEQIKNNKEIKLNTHTPSRIQGFHIVVGSFSSKKNAEALAKQMKNRGFKNARIIGQNINGLIRVSVSSFYTEEDAKEALKDVQKRLNSGWILKSEK